MRLGGYLEIFLFDLENVEVINDETSIQNQ